jgi:(E)-4-hydroxy-3-methylbut-2-enyl-diphosphate synthase
VYLAGQQHHRLKDQDIVEHMAELIEKKAAEIEAAKAANPGAANDGTAHAGGAAADKPAA